MKRRASPVLAVVLASVLVSSCGSAAETAGTTTTTEVPTTTTEAPTTTTTTTDTSTTPTTEPPTSSPQTTDSGTPTAVPSPAAVYWSWVIPTISAGTPERLGAGGRSAESPSDAIDALLLGPNELETEIGMATNIPAETSLLGLEIDGPNATIDVSSEFEVAGGTLGETFRIGQVVFTLTHFDEIERVFFRIDGEDRTEIGSHGIDVESGLTRDDFADIRALISIEGPFPGATVPDSFSVTGEANTFEAGVEWVLVDADGLIIAEGFGTADAGNGTWGRFALEVDVPAGTTGRGAIIAFNTSARDGAQENVVEYPIVFAS